MKFTLALFFFIAHHSNALTGYDCGIKSPNITTFSLKEIEKCEEQEIDPEVENINIQLLQKIEHAPVFIRSCRIKVHRQIKYCNWMGYATTTDESVFFDNISEDICVEIHRTGRFEYEKKIVRELIVNATNNRFLLVAGTMQDDGNCKGATFSVADKTYKSVVVSVNLEITLYEGTVIANREKEEVGLPSGTRCLLKRQRCIDSEHNYVFWAYHPKAACDFEQFVLLFEGKGVRVGNNSKNSPEVYFANSTREIQFGLTKTDEITLCGYSIYKTEHSKLFITEYTSNQGPPLRKEIKTEDIVMSAYFNTKIALLANHMKTQFVSLYKDIVMHRCRLERGIIENSLLHIHNKPDIVALTIMKKPGYIAIKAGEVAHMISCEPINCKIRHIQECYQEIPVYCKNESYFLKPQSHIMTPTGTPADCSSILPVMFKIESSWHQFTPTISTATEPQMIKPMSNITWKYEDMQNLIESGNYKQSDLEKLRQHVMFPAERPALLEEVARKLSDRSINSGSHSIFQNLIDKSFIEEITESKLRKVWDGFTQFGIYAAGVMGVIAIFHFIKSALDIILRGYALKTALGWGVHVLGAVWGSLTHLIITVAQQQQYQQQEQPKQQDQLQQSQYPTQPQLQVQGQPPAYDLNEIVVHSNNANTLTKEIQQKMLDDFAKNQRQ